MFQKSKLNKYQTHFHCAALPEEVWSKLDLLFTSWRNKAVDGQPCDELKQTHLFDLFRLKDLEEKSRALQQLAEGQISFSSFKEACLKG